MTGSSNLFFNRNSGTVKSVTQTTDLVDIADFTDVKSKILLGGEPYYVIDQVAVIENTGMIILANGVVCFKPNGGGEWVSTLSSIVDFNPVKNVSNIDTLNGKFIAWSVQNGGLYISSDGVNWTTNSSFEGLPVSFYKSNTEFLVYKGGKLYITSDLVTWVEHTIPVHLITLAEGVDKVYKATDKYVFHAAGWNKPTFYTTDFLSYNSFNENYVVADVFTANNVAYAFKMSTKKFLNKSIDGITWGGVGSQLSTLMNADLLNNEIVAIKGVSDGTLHRLAVTASSGHTYYSDDQGDTWSKANIPKVYSTALAPHINGLTITAPRKATYVGYFGVICNHIDDNYVLDDTLFDLTTKWPHGERCVGIFKHLSGTIFVGYNGSIVIRSSNNVTYKGNLNYFLNRYRPNGTASYVGKVCYDGISTLVILIGQTLYYSTDDGTTLQTATSENITTGVFDFVFKNNKFYIVTNGFVHISTDGIVWTKYTTNKTGFPYPYQIQIMNNGKMFVHAYNFLYTSTDNGVTFNKETFNIAGIVNYNDVLVCQDSGVFSFRYTVNGTDWITVPAPISSSLPSMTQTSAYNRRAINISEFDLSVSSFSPDLKTFKKYRINLTQRLQKMKDVSVALGLSQVRVVSALSVYDDQNGNLYIGTSIGRLIAVKYKLGSAYN